jgi:hypothetical protein
MAVGALSDAGTIMRAVLTVVSTLLAVVVGGAITYFGQTQLDNRRHKRELEREAEEAEAELRVAKRLMAEEMDTLALHHALLVFDGRYPKLIGAAEFFLPTITWEAYKRTLALGLSDADWEELAPFMHSAGRVRLIVAGADPGSPVDTDTLGKVRNGAILARDLHDMLEGKPAPSVTADGLPTYG